MILTNFHTHCLFCDGKQDPETIVKQAIKTGFTAIGFSSHAPLPFPNTWTMKKENVAEYLGAISRLKTMYQGQIEIYLGMEIDYLSSDNGTAFSQKGLDYTIGSVHFVTDKQTGIHYPIDNTPELFKDALDRAFKNNIEAYIREYYRIVSEMVTRHKPSIVGHFDLVKKFNRDGGYFNESEAWYRDAVTSALKDTAQSGTIVEINTSIRYRNLGDEEYPSKWILKLCREMNIPIMINSDAHSVDRLDAGFAEAREAAKVAGFAYQRVMLNGCWTDIEI